jgi:opacity protein-like surface antigen
VKNSLLLSALLILTIGVQAQKIGVLVGIDSQTASFPENTLFSSSSDTGIHLGVFAKFDLSEDYSFQPEITFSNVKEQNPLDNLGINAIFKRRVLDNFNLQLGPQLSYVLGTFSSQDYTKFNFQLALGAGMDINDNLMAQIRYGLQLNNHYIGDENSDYKINSLSVSLGYIF